MMDIAFPIAHAEIDTLAALLAKAREERTARQRAWEDSQRTVIDLRLRLAAAKQALRKCQKAVERDVTLSDDVQASAMESLSF